MNNRRCTPISALLTLLVLLWSPIPVGAGPPGCGASTRYQPPLRAVIVDRFRLPGGPYNAGNRGIEYRPEPGMAVGAIGAGEVVFAGPVAGSLYVTIRHRDGLRSSYSYLAGIVVAVGDTVRRGQPIGFAGERLHLGVRRGTTYLDPASLFGRGEVRLIPNARFGSTDPPVSARPVGPVAGTCAEAG